MPKDFPRQVRIADLLRREIATILQREAPDLEIGWASVLEVELSKDMQYATVYVSFLEEQAELIKAYVRKLNTASPHLRFKVSQQVVLKYMPKLRFVYDHSIAESDKLSRLLYEEDKR